MGYGKRVAVVLSVLAAAAAAGAADFSQAMIVYPAAKGRAAQVLAEEIDKRAQIRLPIESNLAGAGRAAILLGTREELRRLAPALAAQLPVAAPGAEGYSIATVSEGGSRFVLVAGNDELGTLFGAGRLLRLMDLRRGRITFPDALSISTAPKYRLRGHQLGYRPKTNSYDGWDVKQWDQYIRELALFGANAIELMPPRTDDDADSPHFPLPPLRMMQEMSRIAQSYGLQCWVWYPAMDKDYSDPATVQSALQEWEVIFKALPKIDAIFVPGGDPGHTPPKHLMALLEKQTAVLRRHHPRASMWVSPQSFSAEWMEEFYSIVNQNPAWLGGIVFGPQNRVSLEELRARIPARYPIRFYPDITHTLRAQYPVPDWDVAFALTLQREPINPRPVDQAIIFRRHQPSAEIGFLTYSEGCNDDVNKFVWSALGWDPDTAIPDIVRDYARFFIGPESAEAFAQGLLALESNWRGPLAANRSVDSTLTLFRHLEKTATPFQKANWRFQQALYRAYYDAYIRVRLLDETLREERAMAHLRNAPAIGSLAAIDAAESALHIESERRAGADLRARVFELAEALFQSVRMQLSVARYQAIAVGRGANLDLVDFPLNNAEWLRSRFAEIRAATQESERLKRIDAILNWTNPGPGGFYDDLGDPLNQPHLVRPVTFEQDPAFLKGAATSFSNRPSNRGGRISWWTMAESFNDAPLELRYNNLDRKARYRIRILYAGDAEPKPVRLVADGKYEIHPFQEKNRDFIPVEYDVPAEATSDGSVTFTFSKPAGLGGNGRGVQVAEVWLIRSGS
jgi:hypothetical protein